MRGLRTVPKCSSLVTRLSTSSVNHGFPSTNPPATIYCFRVDHVEQTGDTLSQIFCHGKICQPSCGVAGIRELAYFIAMSASAIKSSTP